MERYDKLPDAAGDVVRWGRVFKGAVTRWNRTKGTNANNGKALRDAAAELFFAARKAATLALDKLGRDDTGGA